MMTQKVMVLLSHKLYDGLYKIYYIDIRKSTNFTELKNQFAKIIFRKFVTDINLSTG